MKEQTIKKHNNYEMLSDIGINTSGEVYLNLDADTLIQHAVSMEGAALSDTGALVCLTGQHTGRSPNDKFIVEDAKTRDMVDWGKVNKPMTPEHFARLRADQAEYLADKNLYVGYAYAGAQDEYRVPISVINETAWANLFCKQLFRRLEASEIGQHAAEFTIVHSPNFEADPQKHGTNSSAFIVVNFSEGLILIGGTNYAGEMKKSIFSVLNFVYPQRGVLPMHCSANISKVDPSRTALFFGLSGTGKTTLSSDTTRQLIGDDEHGWSTEGIFNFEGGCYAKCVTLSKENEPQIWNAIRRGAILENVVIDPKTKIPDYHDVSLTENTRAAYPIEHIDEAILKGTGNHPEHIVFLTCDAFGVMPPISKLTPEQAMYHFLSGYTAKVAGTEKGMGNSPQATFSTCFGSPFLPLKPTVYAEMLGRRIAEHNSQCWLVNTGWIGGGVGVGNRISLKYTRAMVQAALNGELNGVEVVIDEIFGLSIPASIQNIPGNVLRPWEMWKDLGEYKKVAMDLAKRFVDNFARFEAYMPELHKAGPRI
ncbi:MAG: phosphoenolpyruvate carboxykinase (ATP) [Deltaproteobacteria bacterium]|nr:phosphoenolpyruvate carboxykinase (ATP) [Deltaproteobacteria bacterium]